MQMVRFTRAMAPYSAGDQRAVPEELAARLVAAGEAVRVASVFDQASPLPDQPQASRGRQTYRTRGDRR